MKLSLNMKLFLLALIPLVGLLYFAGVKLYDEYRYKHTLEKIKEGMEFNQKISSLIEEIQKERALSLKLLAQKKEFDEELAAQRKKVDEKIENLDKFANSVNLNEFPKDILPKIDSFLSLISQLKEQRKYIDNLSVTSDTVIDYYSAINSELLDLLSLTVKNSYHDSRLSSLLYAYTLYMPMNEVADLKSMVLFESMFAGGVNRNMFIKLIQAITQQELLHKEFVNTLPETFKKKLDFIVNDDVISDEERIKVFSLQNENIEEEGEENIKDVDLHEWYNIALKKSETIKKAQKEFLDEVFNEIQKSSSKSLYGVIIAGVVIFLTLILFVSIMFHLPEFKFQLEYFKSKMRRRFKSWSEY